MKTGPHGEALTAVGEDNKARSGAPEVSITPTEVAIAPDSGRLGGIERLCHDCGDPWELGRNCRNCGGAVFDERVIEPVPIEFAPGRTGLGGFLRSLVNPDKVKSPPLAAEDVAVLRHAAEAGRAYCDALLAADRVMRRVVNAGMGTRETTGYLQAKLDVASSTTGDFGYHALDAKGSLVLPIRTLAQLIEETLQREAAK